MYSHKKSVYKFRIFKDMFDFVTFKLVEILGFMKCYDAAQWYNNNNVYRCIR